MDSTDTVHLRSGFVAQRPAERSLDFDDANRLAVAVQKEVPLVARPFDALAEQLDLPVTRVLGQLRYWERAGLLREVSAVLEGSALGYDSALVCARVPLHRLSEVGELVNRMPTVTHNYVREHAYNLWFTIACPVDWSLEAALAALTRDTGVEFHALRRTLTFKVGVNFDLESKRSRTEAVPLAPPAPVLHSEDDRAMFRTLQRPLPLHRDPFARLAAPQHMDADALLGFARHHAAGGAIRRFVATFRHRKLGVRANGMVVWNVPPERLAELGSRLAEHPEVSHCYAREPAPGFPYRLYTMLHGPDRESVIRTARGLAHTVGTDDKLVLFSTIELKKCRLRYFLPELDEWWNDNVRATP